HEQRIRQLEAITNNLTTEELVDLTPLQPTNNSDLRLAKLETAITEPLTLLAKNLTQQQLQDNTLSFDLNGNLKVNQLQAETVVAGNLVVKKSGEGKIGKGEAEAEIFEEVSSDSKVYLSAIGDNDGKLVYLEDIKEETSDKEASFVVRFSPLASGEVAKEDIRFYWFIVD
ncbi:MAG TPA: hypothetical protein GX706_00895, partial [Candidatus Moranbacteria bacterium]|nr:hypothetical protein [Candidatus Moranbacteria bacterium]